MFTQHMNTIMSLKAEEWTYLDLENGLRYCAKVNSLSCSSL